MMQRRNVATVAVLVVPFALDLYAKNLAESGSTYGNPVAMIPGFNLTLLHNPGISFGLFPAGTSTGLMFMLSVQTILCLGIGVYAWSKRDQFILWPLLLLLSGALANLVDRVFNGAVTDYLDFYIGTSHWPAFNLADVWITLGVARLIATEFMRKPVDKTAVNQEG